MTKIREWLGSVPRRYLVLAAVAALVAGLLTLRTASFVARADGPVPPVLVYLLNLLLAALTPLACVLALRQLMVPVVLVAVPTAILLVLTSSWPLTTYLTLLAIMVVAAWEHPRQAWEVGVVAMLLPLTYPIAFVILAPDGARVARQGTGDGWAVFAMYAIGTAMALGAAVWFRRGTVNSLALRTLAADRAEVGNTAAVLDERARLARDLHDVVAHHVSLIAVRAETAPYTVADLSPGARAALADIAEDSRRALDELRGVLGVLRRGDGGQPDLAPQPGVLDVAELVEHARHAGAVSYDGEAALAVLDQARGYVAYRVVQEALTNARRHAAGQHVAVTCEPRPAGVRITVVNRTADEGPVDPGRGLTGMRERVEAVGGVLDLSRRDSGFTVTAVLPT